MVEYLVDLLVAMWVEKLVAQWVGLMAAMTAAKKVVVMALE